MSDEPNLEVRYSAVPAGVVALFGIAFAVGLVLYLLDPGSAAAGFVLTGGLFLVMAAPAVRLLLVFAERARRRDWLFVMMTAVVLLELAIVFGRAAAR